MAPPIASHFFQFIFSTVPIRVKTSRRCLGQIKTMAKRANQEEHEYSARMLMHTPLLLVSRVLIRH